MKRTTSDPFLDGMAIKVKPLSKKDRVAQSKNTHETIARAAKQAGEASLAKVIGYVISNGDKLLAFDALGAYFPDRYPPEIFRTKELADGIIEELSKNQIFSEILTVQELVARPLHD